VKDPLLYIIHIHEALKKVLAYTRDGREAFMADPKTQDAVIRNFEVIGEATKRLPTEFTTAYPQVPWRGMAGFRDIPIHAYERVDMEEIRNIIEQHVPRLLSTFEDIRSAVDK